LNQESQQYVVKSTVIKTSGDTCSICGGMLVQAGACKTCNTCGASTGCG